MRLWHTDLIQSGALPRQQLLGQWRELNSIFKNQDKHLLINFVYDYPKDDLYWYTSKVLDEKNRRGYRSDITNMVLYGLYQENCNGIKENPFSEKMTDKYLAENYFNLMEKYDCGGMTDEGWEKIDKVARERVKNWVLNNL